MQLLRITVSHKLNRNSVSPNDGWILVNTKSDTVKATNPYKANDRTCWQIKLTLTDGTGKQKHVRKSTGVPIDAPDSLSKAHAARLKILADYQANHDPSAPLRVKEFAKQYMKEKEAEGLSPITLKGIDFAFRNLIKSIGGNPIMSTITVQHIRELLFKYDKSASVAIAHYRYLRTAFKRAMRDEIIFSNPIEQIDAKQLRKRFTPRPRGLLSAEQVNRIYEMMHKGTYSDQTYANYFLLLFGTAFRRSEACFLKEDAVNLKDGIISVVNTAEHRLKTDASADDIPITEHAGIALRNQAALKADHPNERVRESEYIFCNSYGEAYHADTMTKQVILRAKDACKKLKIDHRGLDLHALRHSLLQHLLDSNCPPIMVSKLARHQNLQTTLNFYHKLKDTRFIFDDVLAKTNAMPKPGKDAKKV